MVRAFHARGIKVYLDVVFNHTAEGGAGGSGDVTPLFSLRGLDNATYYELARDAHFYQDNSGVGANLATSVAPTRRLVLDALRYWVREMGADGFRFDLAAVLGNTCARGCFRYERDAATPLTAAVRALPARPRDGGDGVDLIAEPLGHRRRHLPGRPSRRDGPSGTTIFATSCVRARISITWLRADGRRAEGAYMDDATQHFLAWRLDGTEASDPARGVMVLYNRDNDPVRVTLPPARAGGGWYQFADTGQWLEGSSNAWEPGAEPAVTDGHYNVAARSVAVLIERATP